MQRKLDYVAASLVGGSCLGLGRHTFVGVLIGDEGCQVSLALPLREDLVFLEIDCGEGRWDLILGLSSSAEILQVIRLDVLVRCLAVLQRACNITLLRACNFIIVDTARWLRWYRIALVVSVAGNCPLHAGFLNLHHARSRQFPSLAALRRRSWLVPRVLLHRDDDGLDRFSRVGAMNLVHACDAAREPARFRLLYLLLLLELLGHYLQSVRLLLLPLLLVLTVRQVVVKSVQACLPERLERAVLT